jgi:Ca2+-binding EF-hand superfamily protein
MAEQIRRPRDAGHFAMVVSVTLVSLFGLIIRSPANDAISALDTDKDGTVDIEEAETAASQIFYLSDRDKDGTLDINELAGRLDAAALKDRDADNDGTLDHNEYAKAVAIQFKAADLNGDSKLDSKELNTPAGSALLKLIEP